MSFLNKTGCIVALLLSSQAEADVLEINDWSNTSRLGWDYNQVATGNPSIDAEANTHTPSGGGALKSTHPAGTYPTSYGGGRAAYTFPGDHTEIYVGHWMKWSSNWVWHPVGTKIDYMTMRGAADGAGHRDNFLVMIQNNGTTFTFTQQLWNAPGTQNRYNNRASVNMQRDRWYWLEIHVRLNTVGQANGLLEIWLGDQLILQHSDVTYRTTNTVIGNFSHSPEYGGGPFTLPATQYLWSDHTVLSTTRIGMPGGMGGASCGDGSCSVDETCSSCSNDCAECPVDGKPAPVTDLAAVANSSGGVDLTFTEVDDGTGVASKYDIRFANPPMQWGSAASVATGTCALPVLGLQTGQTRTCTVTGLTPDMDYQFQLVSYRGTLNQDAVFGVLSNVASATTSIGGGDVESSGCNVTARNSGLVGFILLSLSMLRMRKRVGRRRHGAS